MNDLQERMERLLDEPWLEGDVTAIEARARTVRARQRRVVAAGVLALVVVLGAGAVVAGRPDRGGPATLDAADQPEPVYEQADSQLMVFLVPEASSADRDAIRAAIAADPAVGQAWWRSQQDAYEEFRCLFIDNPEMIESVTPAILPTSFDVALVDGADPVAFEARMRANASVSEVVTPGRSQDPGSSGTSIPWRPAQQTMCDGQPRGGEPLK